MTQVDLPADAPALETSDPAPDPRRWAVLAVMSVGTLMVFLDDTVVNTALPQISVALDASTSALQWVVDAYVLLLAGLLLLGGSIGDRFGRKKAMSTGLAIFGLAAIGAALSTSTTELIAARAGQGIGAALVLPATLSIITSVFPRHERPKAIAAWTAVGGIGAGAGPILGGWLVDHADWGAAFWIFVPLVVAGLAGMVIVPESKQTGPTRLDGPGAVLGTATLTAIVFGIIRGGELGWGDRSVVVSLVLGAFLLAGFVAVELRSPAPMLPMRLFRQRDFTGAVVLIGVVMFAMFVTFFFLTQFLQLVQGRSALAAGTVILGAPVGLILGAGVAGKLIHTVGPRALATGMTLLAFAGLCCLTQISGASTGPEIAAALWLFGLGAGLGLPVMTDTVMAAVPERDAGIGSAVNDVSRQLGGALGVALIGSIVNHAYRSNLQDATATGVPADALHTASESIGIAARTAAALPGPAAEALTQAVHASFVDAITTGIAVSAGAMGLALVVALTMLPRRLRPHQADEEPAPRLEDA